jgi:hypothetical protein
MPWKPRDIFGPMALTLHPPPDRSPALQEKFPDYRVMHGGLRIGRV